MCEGLSGACACSEIRLESSYKHTHGQSRFHNLFSDSRESYRSQFCDCPVTSEDEPSVAEARTVVSEKPGADSYKSLGDALCFQLRYKEAAQAYANALKYDYCDYYAHRRLALCFLKTLRFAFAKGELLWCARRNADSLDLLYRLGLCDFYSGNYTAACEYFSRCYALCEGNGNMHVATVYWHALSLIRAGESVGSAMRRYDKNIPIGHHRGYLLACRLFSGEENLESVLKKAENEEELTRTLLLYGAYNYLMSQNRKSEAAEILKKMLSYETYWGSFGWIAAYVDARREGFLL